MQKSKITTKSNLFVKHKYNYMSKKVTLDNFITRAHKIHNYSYDYSDTVYNGMHKKISIRCQIHGIFEQGAAGHLNGRGCRLCSTIRISKKLSLGSNKAINDFKLIHGNKYDYSKVNYINAHTKVIIICKLHGEFRQVPTSHVNGAGCRKCYNILNLSPDNFVLKAREVHGDRYDYSKTNFINSRTKVTIVCKMHGNFLQGPINHIRQEGCPQCNKSFKISKDNFIKRSNKIHSFKYDYSKTIVDGAKNIVAIICPTHGIFKRTVSSHLQGYGCRWCLKTKSKGEILIASYLKLINARFEEEFRIKDCKNKHTLPFDFAIFDENNNLQCLIEYQGIHHYEVSKRSKDENKNRLNYLKRQFHDLIKHNYCIKNNIKLIQIPYWDQNKINIIIDEILI